MRERKKVKKTTEKLELQCNWMPDLCILDVATEDDDNSDDNDNSNNDGGSSDNIDDITFR